MGSNMVHRLSLVAIAASSSTSPKKRSRRCDIRRAKELAPRGIQYLDVGTSGGVWGGERGCLMIGGDAEGLTTRRSPSTMTSARSL
jgi:3-hydroxyisobutyrate dehydrogenase-like beta-hydroxyacid dehydrogenase